MRQSQSLDAYISRDELGIPQPRPIIYWRLQTRGGSNLVGAFHDLKTLRGALRRLQRRVPAWTDVEVRFNEPF